MTKAYWAPEEDARLEQKLRLGLTAKEIARQLRRSPGSVSGRITTLGLGRYRRVRPLTRFLKGWTSDEDTRLVRGYAAGEAVSRIALDLGRSRNSVVGRAGRLGLVHGEPDGKADGGVAEKVDAPENGGRDSSRDEPPVAGSSPAAPAAPASLPPWRCRTPDCRGTRQPGRDHCAACITAAAAAERSGRIAQGAPR